MFNHYYIYSIVRATEVVKGLGGRKRLIDTIGSMFPGVRNVGQMTQCGLEMVSNVSIVSVMTENWHGLVVVRRLSRDTRDGGTNLPPRLTSHHFPRPVMRSSLGYYVAWPRDLITRGKWCGVVVVVGRWSPVSSIVI